MNSTSLQSHINDSQHRKEVHGWPALLPLLVSCLIIMLMIGCASQAQESPIAQLTRAEAAVASAIDAGAREHAAIELQSAQDNLDSAKQLSDGNYLAALQFAEKAEVDAKLAETKARHADSSSTLKDMEKVLNDLENQADDQRGF